MQQLRLAGQQGERRRFILQHSRRIALARRRSHGLQLKGQPGMAQAWQLLFHLLGQLRQDGTKGLDAFAQGRRRHFRAGGCLGRLGIADDLQGHLGPRRQIQIGLKRQQPSGGLHHGTAWAAEVGDRALQYLPGDGCCRLGLGLSHRGLGGGLQNDGNRRSGGLWDSGLRWRRRHL